MRVDRLLGFGLFLGVQCAAPLPALAAELTEIQERGYLIVAVRDNHQPLSFRDEAGELVGLEIDLARGLATELLGSADAVRFQTVTNEERLATVLEGDVDVAIAGVTATASRSRVVDFSLPYYFDSTAVVTRHPLLRTWEDLSQQTIAILQNSSAIPEIRYALPDISLLGVHSYQEAWHLLETNRADAFAGDVSILAGWIQEFPDYHLIPHPVAVYPLAIVMPKGTQYSDLRRAINSILEEWETEGQLQERIEYWGLP